MRITASQLRRIIKEEARRILRESSDYNVSEGALVDAIQGYAGLTGRMTEEDLAPYEQAIVDAAVQYAADYTLNTDEIVDHVMGLVRSATPPIRRETTRIYKGIEKAMKGSRPRKVARRPAPPPPAPPAARRGRAKPAVAPAPSMRGPAASGADANLKSAMLDFFKRRTKVGPLLDAIAAYARVNGAEDDPEGLQDVLDTMAMKLGYPGGADELAMQALGY